MLPVPLTDCCEILGIDPKTLRHWLKLANLSFIPHPTDARLKCLTREHVQQLARLHGRLLPSAQSPASSALPEGVCASGSSQGYAPHMPENEAEHLQTACSFPSSYAPETNLIQKLSCLETKVATLQEHLTQLALALLQEREHTVERRLSVLETMAAELIGRPVLSASLPTSQATRTGPEPAGAPKPTGQLHPAEQRVRSRMPPLIEYSAQGTYVIISSLEGELHLVAFFASVVRLARDAPFLPFHRKAGALVRLL